MLLKIPPWLVNIQVVLCLLNKQFNSLARIPICVALYYLTSYREVHTPLVFFFVNIDVYPTVCIFTCIYIYAFCCGCKKIWRKHSHPAILCHLTLLFWFRQSPARICFQIQAISKTWCILVYIMVSKVMSCFPHHLFLL